MLEFIKLTKKEASEIIQTQEIGDKIAQQIYDSDHNYGNCVWIKIKKEEV